jgi:very-short-patch-repair endonuclease
MNALAQLSILSLIMTPEERRLLSHVGIKKTLNPPAKFTSLEIRYYEMLKEMKIDFIPQYPLCGRFYDAFLPKEKIILEFDGTFWHPKTEADAKYAHQKKSFKVDVLKNKYAREYGLKIYRIREESPITSTQLRKLIVEGTIE